MKPAADEVEKYLHLHIPISRQMQLRVREISDRGIRLSAPLAPNVNHRSGVFCGSVSALDILAGWTLAHVAVRSWGLTSPIVIQRNSVEYLKPIQGDFEAFCPAPNERSWARLRETIGKRNRARITLEVELTAEADRVDTFTGAYVILQSERQSEAGPVAETEPA